MQQHTEYVRFNELLLDGVSINDIERDNVQKFRVSTPQALIDTDFEYSLQGTKWELVNLNNNTPSVFARANEPAFTSDQITSITISPSSNRDVVVRVNVTPGIPFEVGNPIVLKETTDTTYVDGAYVIKSVSGNNIFVVTTKSPGPLSGTQFKTQYTTLYTGGFYSNSQLLIKGLSSIGGTKNAIIEFTEPHLLFLDSPITVVDKDSPGGAHIGSFAVTSVPSDTRIIYRTTNASDYALSASLLTKLSAGQVYARGEGVGIHRFFDGGVQINPGTAAPNSQIIRQTRKYFRYQSGKSLQFSTGILFKPVYEVTNAYLISTAYNASTYPYYDFYVTTEQYHGFSPVDTYRLGPIVQLKNFVVNNGLNPYNERFEVAEVLNAKTFKVQIPVSEYNPFPTTDYLPGGLGEVEVQGWNDATVRSGMFDDQNGIFFECDGDELIVVKRYSTQPTSGTISVRTNSRYISSFDGNTRFKTQFKEGDYMVIMGQSYAMASILSNVSAYMTPAYRGPSVENIKIYKTIDERYRQAEFNLDRLDGTGPSGYVLDLSKMQMVFIDYSWYGAGKIRFGMRTVEGKIIYFHEIYNNNVNRKAYMRSGNLPGRFEIQSKSKTGVLLTDVTATGLNSVSALISKEDASNIPERGRIIINNEYVNYTKTIAELSGGVVLQFNQRNIGGLEIAPITAPAGDGYVSYNQNCSPALSHWGVSVLMDGNFDVDKSYLFTAATSAAFAVTQTENAILSVRLAPSVDYGIPGPFGIRKLVNRSLVTLKSIGIATNMPAQVIARINAEDPMFKRDELWIPAGNGSIAQYFDHQRSGSFNALGRGGDVIAAFYITPQIQSSPGANDARWVSESFNIDIIRELGNSVLGGGGIYPDGPDILTVFVRRLEGSGDIAGSARARISWTEAQG